MSEKVERKKKQIEVEVVELGLEFSAEFFDNMDKAKKQVAAQRGYDVTYGEYIEEAMNDLVKMVDDYAFKLKQASELIKQQDNALGQKSFVIEVEDEDEEGEPEPLEGEAPADLYAHIEADEAKDVMYG